MNMFQLNFLRANPYVVEALIRAAKEFGENPIVGLYRAHDAIIVKPVPP